MKNWSWFYTNSSSTIRHSCRHNRCPGRRPNVSVRKRCLRIGSEIADKVSVDTTAVHLRRSRNGERHHTHSTARCTLAYQPDDWMDRWTYPVDSFETLSKDTCPVNRTVYSFCIALRRGRVNCGRRYTDTTSYQVYQLDGQKINFESQVRIQ